MLVKSSCSICIAAALAACAGPRAIAPLATPGESAVALTGGGNTSMIYLARTSDGVVAIDATFHLADAERARLVGDSSHRGWIPGVADRVVPAGLPGATELEVRTFARDTTFVMGRDTLRAYLVAGHTSGSAVYLFRGVLFLGDAVTWSRRHGFVPARRGFSDDPGAAAANLRELWPRLPTGGVRYACTAHARCAPFTAAFLEDVERRQ